ncbi:hypothetical protein RX327_03600 [Bradyrhizobium sp. BEA-2-5]|uniref:hypothetical protein n=1 Tax=Bradyrhizobium TaxID=374 RepID=UPI000AC7A54F|nr:MULTISPECIES: hypothetical protein [Bradyrhizobium]WOH82288.1 hypothetical protein RX327_03600 [Bradyrhizobium sp. BEA-2-5]
MPDYSLVPVDHQPDFDDYSLVPVDHDPFAADRLAQQAQIQQPPTPTQPAQPQPQTQRQQPATGAGQPGVNGPATGNSPSGSGGIVGIKRFGGDEGGDYPSRNAGIGFESAERAWDAARKEMIDLGTQHYPEETKSRGFIPELGVEIHKRNGLYYYDQIARGFQDGALGGGVGFGDSGAVARGHMHWDNQHESDGDLNNAKAYSQKTPDYRAWVGSWDGSYLYWLHGKPTGSRMPDWNRYKY